MVPSTPMTDANATTVDEVAVPLSGDLHGSAIVGALCRATTSANSGVCERKREEIEIGWKL